MTTTDENNTNLIITFEPCCKSDDLLENSLLPEYRVGIIGQKLGGRQSRTRPYLRVPSVGTLVITFIGAFVSIALLSIISQYGSQENASLDNAPFIIGSFGATAVLLFAAPKSPLAQPRNLIGGHTISALVGVGFQTAFEDSPDLQWLAAALAVSVSIFAMQITGTLHPPGGATALIAVIGPESIKDLSLLYVLIPVLSGAMLMMVVALLSNNLVRFQRYPDTWW
mmetsp:Transcript_16442/g.24548  ORF Transcript_16442/g.24548 Transcript_16442/m.24548 type:complete len:225 (+) Transcript_16442:52-726(+)